MLKLPDGPPSRVGRHDGCADCATFRDWLLARDRAERNLSGLGMRNIGVDALHGLSWLRNYFEWGPTSWPAYWCDFLHADKLDCGAFANVVEAILNDRQVPTARLQIIELASPAETSHWRTLWHQAYIRSTEWIVDDRTVYHEGLVLCVGDDSVLYDTTNFSPIEAGFRRPGMPLWLRYFPDISKGSITWEGVALPAHEWVDVGEGTC